MKRGDSVYIRPIEDSDAEIVLKWENDPANWEVSENDSEYHIDDIHNLIKDLKDVRSARQLRYIINLLDNERVGTVDIAEIDFAKGEGWIGVLVANSSHRGKGYGSESLVLMEQVGLELGLTCFFARIHETNSASIRLFEKCGYQKVEDAPMDQNANYLNTVIFRKWLER